MKKSEFQLHDFKIGDQVMFFRKGINDFRMYWKVIGFEEEMNKIIKLLPNKTRVTCLFSATMTKKVEDLCRLSLKNPVLVEVAKDSAQSTNASLE